MPTKRKSKGDDAKHLTTVRLDPELYEAAKRVAKMSRMSITSVMEQCLEAGLPRLEKLQKEFLNPDQGE